MDFLELARRRYSCKNFDTRPIGKEKLDLILEAGRLAPTAKNLQEAHIYIAESETALASVDACTPCRYHAPTVLVVTYDRENVFTYPGGKLDSGMEDAAIVATHLMLCAASLGIESCWINFFDPEKIAKALGLPENQQAVMLLDLGYPAPSSGPLANHANRKPLSETTTVL